MLNDLLTYSLIACIATLVSLSTSCESVYTFIIIVDSLLEGIHELGNTLNNLLFKISTTKTKIAASVKQAIRTEVVIEDQTLEQVYSIYHLRYGCDVAYYYSRDKDRELNMKTFGHMCGPLDKYTTLPCGAKICEKHSPEIHEKRRNTKKTLKYILTHKMLTN